MTQDDIIKLAREAGIPMSVKLNKKVEPESTVTKEQFCFAALVAAAERNACEREHAMQELSRLGQEIEQEPSQWREMVVATLVREGIKKHRARELADHFAAQRTWVGLEIEEVQDSYNADYQAQTRAVEKLLKERNTT